MNESAAYRTVKGSDNGSLLSIDELSEQEWFDRFNMIESQLTKLFVLIALLRSQGLITQKECA